MTAAGSRQVSYEFVPMPESDHKPSKCPSGYAVAVFAVIAAVLFAGGVLLGYYLRQGWDGHLCRDPEPVTHPTYSPPEANPYKMQDPGDRLERHQKVLNLKVPNIDVFKTWNNEVIMSSSNRDKELMSVLTMDNKSELIHHVIDYPALNKQKSNLIQVLDNSGNVLKEFKPKNQALKGRAFVDFTVDKSVQGDVLFVNDGRIEDYETAVRNGVRVDGKIVLIKVSDSISIPVQMRVAGLFDVQSILLYVEPSAEEECDSYAPTLSAWKLKQHQMPYISVQTVSCQTAVYLLNKISGVAAPNSWAGNLNVSYYIGSRGKDPVAWKLNVTTDNGFMTRMGKSVSHVFRTIKGVAAPDKFLLIGASRTSLIVNKAQSNSEMLLQLYELLSLLKEGHSWKPLRSIKFVWWGGNEFGPVATAAFLKEYQEAYRDDILAYVDIESFHHESDMIQVQVDSALEQLLEYKISELHGADYTCDSGLSYLSQRISSVSSGEVAKTLLSIPVFQVAGYKGKSLLHNNRRTNVYCMKRDVGLKMAALLISTMADAGIIQTNLSASIKEFSTKQKLLQSMLAKMKILHKPSPLSHELEYISSTARNLTKVCLIKKNEILDSENYHEDNYRRAINSQITKTYSCISKADESLFEIIENLPYDKREHAKPVVIDSVMIRLKEVKQHLHSALRVLEEDFD